MTSTKTQKHIHIWNKKVSYAQNEDGSPHDKGNNKQGPLPNKVQNSLFEKTGWDYNSKREDFFSETVVQYDVGGVYCEFADGTSSFKANQRIGPVTLPIPTDTNGLEDLYYCKDLGSGTLSTGFGNMVVSPIIEPVVIPSVAPVFSAIYSPILLPI